MRLREMRRRWAGGGRGLRRRGFGYTGQMGVDSDPEGQQTSVMSLRAGLALSGMTDEQLWFSYVGVGGTLGQRSLVAALNGELVMSAHEHNVVAQALNDHFTERGQNHPVAYSGELDLGLESEARGSE
jgi:hypothetical protein